jgi:hypothetical protein
VPQGYSRPLDPWDPLLSFSVLLCPTVLRCKDRRATAGRVHCLLAFLHRRRRGGASLDSAMVAALRQILQICTGAPRAVRRAGWHEDGGGTASIAIGLHFFCEQRGSREAGGMETVVAHISASGHARAR